jgi:hypothetical protein
MPDRERCRPFGAEPSLSQPSSPVGKGGGREKRVGVMRANLPGAPT